jgi:cyclase
MRKLIHVMIMLAAVPILAQRDFNSVQIQVEKVAGNTYMLVGAGGNIGVSVGDDGILIVDDQYAPLAPKIKEALRTISHKPVKFVLNTHYHGDHTGGNEEFGETAPIIAHTNVRRRLAAGGPENNPPPAPKGALPGITFDERLAVHLNGETIRAVHVPHGHTDGDAVIYFTQSNVVHMGDDFFAGRFPYIDLDGGGSVKGLMAGIEKVLGEIKPDTRIIPGHGPLSTPADLRAYVNMLKETFAIVQKGVKAGKTLDQLKKEKVLKKYDSLSWQFITTDKFLETLHRDATIAARKYKH